MNFRRTTNKDYDKENFPTKCTPIKIGRRHRTVDKDSACLCCGTILVGIRCTYNLKTCEGVQEKLEKLLECHINIDQNSCRLCKSCFRRIDSLTKRYSVLEADLKELRTKYSTLNSRTPDDSLKLKCTSPKARSNVQVVEVIKRCAKSSPHRPRKKARGPLFESLTQHYSNLDFTPLYVDQDVNDRACHQQAPIENEECSR